MEAIEMNENVSQGMRPPGLAGWFREMGSVASFGRLALELPWLMGRQQGGGTTVMVLPGFGGGDASTLVLRNVLRRSGFDARPWRLGLNTGDVPALTEMLLKRVEEEAEAAAQPLTLVGWSLGGVLAREVARDRPDLVRKIVTLGSPVVGGPAFTNAASLYRAAGMDLEWIQREVHLRNQIPIQVPVTAIYSKADGVVDWRACIDRHNAQVRHVEVRVPHVALGFDPGVLRLVIEVLMQNTEIHPVLEEAHVAAES